MTAPYTENHSYLVGMDMRGLLAGAVLAIAMVAPAAAQFGPAPSWRLSQGAAGVCTEDDVSIPNVYINVPAPLSASEQGVYSAPGFPNLGFTQDSNFQGVGTFNFLVFTAPYVLPANTPVTLRVYTYNGPNFTGGIAFESWVTWDCTDGTVLAIGDRKHGAVSVPTLGEASLIALALLLFVLGARSLSSRRA
mgnify:CR=1 FL=1